MSLVTEEEFEKKESWSHHLKLADNCFACGERLGVPFVFWNAPNGNLCLHVRCAGVFGAAIFRDYHETIRGKSEADKHYRRIKEVVKL